MDDPSAAAQVIVSARCSRTPLLVLPVTVRPKDEDEGYRVQDTVHELLADTEWGQVVGHKIGCTTSVMQHYLGIPNPCAGGVFTSGVHASGVTLNSGNYVRVGIECEIAFRLQRDLGLSHKPFTADAVSGPPPVEWRVL